MFSLVALLLAVGIGIFLQPQVRGHRGAMLVLGLTSMLLIITGLVLGIAALVATRRHGRAGIFGRALAGTIFNGLRVVLMLAGMLVLFEAMGKVRARPPPLEQKTLTGESGR